MATPPIPGLSLGISPSSSASSATGLDMMGGYGGAMTGAANVGSGASDTWVTGIVRDFAMGVAVALAAKWAWGKVR